jgi:DNA helicase-2/ATP-dependent DNA helicase PcrA
MEKFEFTDEEIKSVCLELDIPITAFNERESERRIIIDHWGNANIIACPGSGKTTVLLAKLLLLSRRMPFKDGSGICVLTHTNVAIDEIKSKLGNKADILFKHPNFFGTIQSFVDKYLVIPAFSLYPRIELNRISRIDSSHVYYQKKNCFYDIGFGRNGSKTLCHFLYGQANRDSKKDASSKVKTNNAIDFLASLKFDITDNVIKRSNGKTLIKDPTKENYRDIKDLIFSLWDKGYLSFEDTFNFANWYTTHYGSLIKPIFEKRFKFLFVDEMQDTQKHQMSIIDSVFNTNVVRQYFGDPDQAIFNDGADEASAWNIKDEKFLQLEIKDSKRYSSAISECLNPFKNELSDVVGTANWTSLKPMILLYDDPEDAIDLFYDEIKKNNLLQEEAFINWNRESSPFNIVGFIGKKPEQGNDKVTIHSYVRNYSRDTAKRNMNFDTLVSYFQKRPIDEISQSGTRVYYSIFINAFIAILALNSDKTHTKLTLVSELRDTKPTFFNKYNIKIFNWIQEIESEKKQANEIKREFLNLLSENGYTLPICLFITDNNISSLSTFKSNTNIISKDGIEIKVGTIHSVKGETHMATLLLENENHSKFESSYFFNEQSGNLFCGEKYERPQNYIQLESRLKTTYVAMSRPTHLLCVAMKRVRVDCITCGGTKKENCKWEVVNLLGQRH